MDLLLLTVPAQHGASNPAVITDPRRLRQWLEGLPLDAAAEMVPRVSAALVQLNELQLADSTRLKLLEQYRQLLDGILFSCDDMGLDAMGLDAATRRHLVEDILWLFQSLANGYKIVVRNRFDKGALVARDGSMLFAACRALEVLSLTLLYACRAHVPPPPMTFLEINQLYALGESHAALAASVRVEGGERCLGGLFRQYALFAVSQQMHWEGTDLLHLYTFLERFAEVCEIHPESSHEHCEGAYRIDLGEDQAPVPGAWQSTPTGRPSRRLLDVWPVVNALGTWLAAQDDDADTFTREAEMGFVERLVTHLADPVASRGAGP